MLGKAGHCYFINEAVVEPREAYKQSIFFHIKGRWHHHKPANGRDLGTEFGSGTNLGARHVRILLFRKVRSQPKLSSFFVDDDGDGLVLWCGHPIADGNHQRLSVTSPANTHHQRIRRQRAYLLCAAIVDLPFSTYRGLHSLKLRRRSRREGPGATRVRRGPQVPKSPRSWRRRSQNDPQVLWFARRLKSLMHRQRGCGSRR